jgi:hypothetical protein
MAIVTLFYARTYVFPDRFSLSESRAFEGSDTFSEGTGESGTDDRWVSSSEGHISSLCSIDLLQPNWTTWLVEHGFE